MGDFWWALILGSLYGALIFTWIFTLIDLFRRSDLTGFAKAMWLLAVIFFPVFGMIFYFIFRPDTPRAEDMSPAQASEGWYANPVSPATELEKLSLLRNNGTLTDEEYARMKARIV